MGEKKVTFQVYTTQIDQILNEADDEASVNAKLKASYEACEDKEAYAAALAAALARGSTYWSLMKNISAKSLANVSGQVRDVFGGFGDAGPAAAVRAQKARG
jgi:hypothetical protein